MMKRINSIRIAMCVCVVLMAVTSAQATIVGSGTWSREVASADLDRLVLTVQLFNHEETMTGFDIAIYDPLSRGLFVTGGDPIFKAGKDLDTSFLLNKNHKAGTVTVTDLVVAGDWEDGNLLQAGFAYAAGGAYEGGWTGALQLAEILVPTGSFSNPYADLTATRTGTYQGWPRCDLGEIMIGPEPSTLALLATGLMGLLAYNWRRKRAI
jgi:hypothetical protein